MLKYIRKWTRHGEIDREIRDEDAYKEVSNLSNAERDRYMYAPSFIESLWVTCHNAKVSLVCSRPRRIQRRELFASSDNCAPTDFVDGFDKISADLLPKRSGGSAWVSL